MALQHAEWALSASRGGTKTDPKVFAALPALLENRNCLNIQKSVQIAELTPLNVKGVRVIISIKRIAMDTSEVEEIITTIDNTLL